MKRAFDQLAAAGADFADVVATLERDGIAKFQGSWTHLLDDVARGTLRPSERC